MHGTLKQQVYSAVTGNLSGGFTVEGSMSDYTSCGKDKTKKVKLLQETALEIHKKGISEQDARQVINAIENKKRFLTFGGIFNSLGERELNYFDA